METLKVGVIWLFAIAATSPINGGTNRLEHAALCSLVTLADGKLKATEVAKLQQETYQLIQNLNFSTATKDWQDSFYLGAKYEKVHNEPQEYHKGYEGYGRYWGDWKKAAEAAIGRAKETTLAATGVLELDEQGRRYAHARIRTIAERAKEIWDNTRGLRANRTVFNEDDVNKRIRKTVYGTDDGKRDRVLKEKVFTGDETKQRTKTCTAEAGQTQVTTVAAMLSCICLKGTGGGAAGICTDAANGQSTWGSSGQDIGAADIQAVLGTCPSGTDQNITAAKIRAAMHNVRALLTGSNGDAYLGRAKNSNCNGDNDNGRCVTIKGYDKDPAAAFDRLDWTRKLHEIAKELEDREAEAVLAAQTNKLLGEEAGKAMAVVKEAREATTAAESRQNTQQPGPRKEEKDRCSKHNSNATCAADNNCKWEEEKDGKGECTPKPGTETAAAGAGEKTTEKCKGKPEKDCKSPDCRWEGETCKDSSILVNKHFALSLVSAAFAALLF